MTVIEIEIERMVVELIKSGDPIFVNKIENIVKETMDNYLQSHIQQAITDCVEAKLESLEIKVNL